MGSKRDFLREGCVSAALAKLPFPVSWWGLLGPGGIGGLSQWGQESILVPASGEPKISVGKWLPFCSFCRLFPMRKMLHRHSTGQCTMKAEIKISPSMGQTAGSVGTQCRNEFPTCLSGTNHPVPLQVLGSSTSYSGSYEPKLRFLSLSIPPALLVMLLYVTYKQAQAVTYCLLIKLLACCPLHSGTDPCSAHMATSQRLQWVKAEAYRTVTTKASMRSSIYTTSFCIWFPFKMGHFFSCNALSSTWLIRGYIGYSSLSSPTSALCTPRQQCTQGSSTADQDMDEKSKSEVEQMRHAEGADWFLPEETTAGIEGACQKRLSQQERSTLAHSTEV